MKKRNLRSQASIGLAALALAMSVGSVAAFAQFGPYYPAARKLNDNGSVYEPGPGPAPAAMRHLRHARLYNYAPQYQPQRRYYPAARKLNDNGSVDEPGPGR